MADEIIKILEYLLTNPLVITFGIIGPIIFILTFGFTFILINKSFREK